jgi:predicted transcriptional regulator
MATMTVRTTVAFDPATAARLDRLAKRWGVSKSETLRRALETVEQQAQSTHQAVLTDEEIARMTPREAFSWLQAHPQVPAGWGADFRRELKEARERDAVIEEERELTRSKVAEPNSHFQA